MRRNNDWAIIDDDGVPGVNAFRDRYTGRSVRPYVALYIVVAVFLSRGIRMGNTIDESSVETPDGTSPLLSVSLAKRGTYVREHQIHSFRCIWASSRPRLHWCFSVTVYVLGIGAGLRNVGSSCYMNVVYFALNHLPPLVKYLGISEDSNSAALSTALGLFRQVAADYIALSQESG